MNINFVYVPTPHNYDGVIDTMVDPIIKHLPEARKVEAPVPGDLNINFFTEPDRIKGCEVFISHGIADKLYRTANRVSAYPHVFVSGPAWRDLYARNGRREGVHIGGYTKLDPIFQGVVKKSKKKIKVLWCPTHGSFNLDSAYPTSSYPQFEPYLDRIPGLEVALHPAHNDGVPTIQKLLDAQVVIADHGSTVYEALALGKPVIIPDWIVKHGIMRYFLGSFEALIFEQGFCYHARDLDHLLELIEVAHKQGIDAHTKNFIDAIFPPELRGKSGEATANMLREIARGDYGQD